MTLKLQNRRLYPAVFLAGCTVAFGTWWFGFKGHSPEVLFSLVGGVTGLTYFLYRQHLDETKLFRDLFKEFNTRYDDLNDDLNMILFGPTTGPLSLNERECLFAYFNLCAEEFFFYNAGYIDCDVWESWHRGMKVFFKQPRVWALWEEDCQAGSYYHFRPPH